jgi:hypothetical protein
METNSSENSRKCGCNSFHHLGDPEYPQKMAETLEITRERVGYIIHEILDMIKFSVKLVPECLNEDQKRGRACLTGFFGPI